MTMRTVSTYVNTLALKSIDNTLPNDERDADLRAAKYIHDRIVTLHSINPVDHKPVVDHSDLTIDLATELQLEIDSYKTFVREDRLYHWGSADLEDRLDGHRRAIAGYYQALQLYLQGPTSFAAAYEDHALIFQGRR